MYNIYFIIAGSLHQRKENTVIGCYPDGIWFAGEPRASGYNILPDICKAYCSDTNEKIYAVTVC